MAFEWDYYEKWAEIRNKLQSLGIEEQYKIYILESLEEYRIKDMYDMLNNRDVLASANGLMVFHMKTMFILSETVKILS